jgi:hypothetical protein
VNGGQNFSERENEAKRVSVSFAWRLFPLGANFGSDRLTTRPDRFRCLRPDGDEIPARDKALRALHADVRRSWTVGQFAFEAGMSRSVFAERATRVPSTARTTR